MFEKYFKSIIMDVLGEFIEDFTDNDVMIDNWNGEVVKENIILKKTALMGLSKMIGVPLEVIDGYAKKLQINIPWNRLWKQPIEIVIEDIYACCSINPNYSQEFAEELLLQYKDGIVNKILQNIKEAEEGREEKSLKTGLLYGYVKTILDNMKFKLTNIHIKFEDIGASIENKSFNFGFC